LSDSENSEKPLGKHAGDYYANGSREISSRGVVVVAMATMTRDATLWTAPWEQFPWATSEYAQRHEPARDRCKPNYSTSSANYRFMGIFSRKLDVSNHLSNTSSGFWQDRMTFFLGDDIVPYDFMPRSFWRAACKNIYRRLMISSCRDEFTQMTSRSPPSNIFSTTPSNSQCSFSQSRSLVKVVSDN